VNPITGRSWFALCQKARWRSSLACTSEFMLPSLIRVGQKCCFPAPF